MPRSKMKRSKKNNIISACLSKTRHETEEDAQESARWQSQQVGCGEPSCCPSPTFDVYRCIFCEGFHIYRVTQNRISNN